MTAQWTNNGATYTTYTVDAADRVTQQVTDPSGLDRTTSISYTPDDQQASVTQSGPDGAVAADLLHLRPGREHAVAVGHRSWARAARRRGSR